jgi:hypothetical protein
MPEPHMNKIIQLTFILTIVFALTSCFGMFDSSSDRIIDSYHVLWIDMQENRGISKEVEGSSGSFIGIVPNYVFEVGYNEHFIIAKQHPMSGHHEGFNIITSVTNYFVIDMDNPTTRTGYLVYGPLSRWEFDSLSTKLKLENIQFDQAYPETYE